MYIYTLFLFPRRQVLPSFPVQILAKCWEVNCPSRRPSSTWRRWTWWRFWRTSNCPSTSVGVFSWISEEFFFCKKNIVGTDTSGNDIKWGQTQSPNLDVPEMLLDNLKLSKYLGRCFFFRTLEDFFLSKKISSRGTGTVSQFRCSCNAPGESQIVKVHW